MFKQCPHCRQQIPVYQWAAHEMLHQGQSPSLPMVHAQGGGVAPSLQQAAAKAPRIYHHPRCGHATALQDADVLAQLQDPFRTSDQAYCSGCKGYVHTAELFWEGTSESLLAANRRQKAEFIRTHGLNPSAFVWDATGPVRRKTQTNWGVIVGLGVGGIALVLLLGVGLTVALLVNSIRGAAAKREPFAAPAAPAFVPIIPQPVGGPVRQPNVMDDLRIRQNDLLDRMRTEQEDVRKRHEQMMQDLQQKLQPPDFPEFPDLGTGGLAPGRLPGFGGADPAADARARLDELQQDSQRRIDELRERSRQRQEEAKQRMEQNRLRFP